jgi:preprotein translocase subunit Sec63
MNAALDHAYRVLGVQPGVSPLAARRRYRELVMEWHPDRHPRGSQSQAEATRRTQEINAAYRTIRHAARHREVPLRPPRPSAPTSSLPMPDPWQDTVADRVIAGAAGVLLGLRVDLWLMWGSAVVWVAVPGVLGIACTALGWRAFGPVMRLIVWWLV